MNFLILLQGFPKIGKLFFISNRSKCLPFFFWSWRSFFRGEKIPWERPGCTFRRSHRFGKLQPWLLLLLLQTSKERHFFGSDVWRFVTQFRSKWHCGWSNMWVIVVRWMDCSYHFFSKANVFFRFFLMFSAFNRFFVRNHKALFVHVAFGLFCQIRNVGGWTSTVVLTCMTYIHMMGQGHSSCFLAPNPSNEVHLPTDSLP